MAEADRVLSTPPTNTSVFSRRTFIAQAASAAAGGTIAGISLPLPQAAEAIPAAPDPILAAIEAHRTAVTHYHQAIETECDLEVMLPEDLRCSSVTAFEETIVEGDDPRWPAALLTRSAAASSTDDLAIELLEIQPTTVAGVEALLRYFASQEDSIFPEQVFNEDGSEETFPISLARHAADALRNIIA